MASVKGITEAPRQLWHHSNNSKSPPQNRQAYCTCNRKNCILYMQPEKIARRHRLSELENRLVPRPLDSFDGHPLCLDKRKKRLAISKRTQQCGIIHEVSSGVLSEPDWCLGPTLRWMTQERCTHRCWVGSIGLS